MDNLLEALKTGSAFNVNRERKEGRRRTPRAAGGKRKRENGCSQMEGRGQVIFHVCYTVRLIYTLYCLSYRPQNHRFLKSIIDMRLTFLQQTAL